MIIDFELLESPDLPDDFFDESLKDIARDEGKVLFMPGINEQSDDKLSSLVSFDFETKTIVTGYKYPQDQAYDIINDMNPTKVVFDWTRKYFGGRPVEFPNVPQFKPIIPPSRFSSNVGMDAFELKMLGRGFRFLKPTRGQWIKYEKHCVEEVEEDFLIYPTEEQIVGGVLNGIGFEEQSKCSIQVEFVKSAFEPENRKYCDLRNKVKNSFKSLVKVVDVPIYYRQCGVPVVVNIGKRNQFDKKVKSEKYVVTILPKHMVVRCLKSKEQVLKDRKIRYERPKYSDTRYYTRYFSQFKEETNALVVGLDFNPFSPYALDVLTSVKMCDTGVEYSRQYKGEEFYGFFKYKTKRYHSDVWFSSIFTEHTPYTRDLIYNDLAVNQYRAEKMLMLNECFTMLGAPLIIEPFAVSKNYSNSKRSMLRYRVSDIGVVTHVPYMTSSIKVSDEYITNFEVIKWDKPIEIIYRNGRSDRYSMYPQKNEKTIEDFFRWFKNVRKAGIEGVEDYDYVMQQYKKWFVLETYEYINNGSVKVKGVEPLVNKNTGVTVPKYMIWKVKEPDDRGDVIKCFFVPYCIRRYPHNNLGTIIGDLTHLTLEEAVSDITLVKELVKDPPWLFGVLKLPSFQNDFKLERVDDDDIEVD